MFLNKCVGDASTSAAVSLGLMIYFRAYLVSLSDVWVKKLNL